MSGKLPEEQGIELIRRLARDDDFRDRFSKDPADAMREVGVSTAVIASLDSACLTARTLAPKEAFATLLDDINGEALQAAMRMQTPEVRVR